MRPGMVARVGVGGAGGGPPAFNPETGVTSATLKGWWDASTLPDADGTSLASWPDSTVGASWPLVQATADAKPTVKTAIQNGLRVVRFDGAGDLMQTATVTSKITGAGGLTFFCVGIRRGVKVDTSLMALYKASDTADWNNAAGVLIAYEGTGGGAGGSQGSYQNSSLRANIASHPGNDVPMLVTAWWDGTNSNLSRRASGATTTATPVANSPTFNIEIARIGSRFGSVGWAWWDYAELLVYQGSLDSTDRAAVQSYLQTKWGIA